MIKDAEQTSTSWQLQADIKNLIDLQLIRCFLDEALNYVYILCKEELCNKTFPT